MFRPSYRKNLNLLGAYQFLSFFGITSFWLLFLSQKGMSLWQIGVLQSCFHITSLLSEIPSGILADRFSYKTNLYLSQIFAILSALLMLTGNGNLWLYAIGMITWAWSYNFDSGTSSAMLYESAKEADCEERYLSLTSLMSGLLEASRALGMVGAGLLAHGLMDWTFYIKITLAILTLGTIALMKEPQEKLADEERPTFKAILQSVKTVFVDKPYLLRWMLTCQTVIVCISSFADFYQQKLTDMTSWQISFVMLLASGINILAVWLASQLGKRWSAQTIFKVITGLASAFLCLTILNKPFIFPIVFLLSDSLIAFFLPIYDNNLQKDLPSNIRATMLSVNGMLYSLAMAVIFPITGFLMDWLGFVQGVLILGAIILIIGLSMSLSKENL